MSSMDRHWREVVAEAEQTVADPTTPEEIRLRLRAALDRFDAARDNVIALSEPGYELLRLG